MSKSLKEIYYNLFKYVDFEDVAPGDEIYLEVSDSNSHLGHKLVNYKCLGSTPKIGNTNSQFLLFEGNSEIIKIYKPSGKYEFRAYKLPYRYDTNMDSYRAFLMYKELDRLEHQHNIMMTTDL